MFSVKFRSKYQLETLIRAHFFYYEGTYSFAGIIQKVRLVFV